jgi:uncharacterized membrane protein YfcA
VRDAIILLAGSIIGLPLGYYLRHTLSRRRRRYYV